MWGLVGEPMWHGVGPNGRTESPWQPKRECGLRLGNASRQPYCPMQPWAASWAKIDSPLLPTPSDGADELATIQRRRCPQSFRTLVFHQTRSLCTTCLSSVKSIRTTVIYRAQLWHGLASPPTPSTNSLALRSWSDRREPPRSAAACVGRQVFKLVCAGFG